MLLKSKKVLVSLLIVFSSLSLYLFWRLISINNQYIEIGAGTYLISDTKYNLPVYGRPPRDFYFVISHDMEVTMELDGELVLHGTLIEEVNEFTIQTDAGKFIYLKTSGNTVFVPVELTIADVKCVFVFQLIKYSDVPYTREKF